MATNLEQAPATPSCVRVATGYNIGSPGNNTNLLGATHIRSGGVTLTPGPNACAYRVQVCLTTGSVFNVRITDGTTAFTQSLNGAVALTASCLYTFTILVSATKADGATALLYNFQLATTGVIQQILVDEISGAVI